MKSLIIYFSQTGNTKKIAEAIRNGIATITGHCDIVKLKDVALSDLDRYDLIGLGCPVFMYKEPANVRNFIDSLPILKSKLGFVFATHATVLGKTLATMSWGLHQKGLSIIGKYHCYGDVFVPYLPYPWFTTGHPDELDIKQAEEFGKQMADYSQKITRGNMGLIPKPRVAEWGHRVPLRGEMILNKEKCRYPQCRLCIDNCPMNGIDLSVDPIVFRRDCISCFFCEQICPYGAIEGNWEALWKAYQKRYRSYQEVAEKAERQGFLRRYFDVELDNPDKIRFKIISSRPRIRLL